MELITEKFKQWLIEDGKADTDIAEEMMHLTSSRITMQLSQSMMA